jgi:hypothetical protein
MSADGGAIAQLTVAGDDGMQRLGAGCQPHPRVERVDADDHAAGARAYRRAHRLFRRSADERRIGVAGIRGMEGLEQHQRHGGGAEAMDGALVHVSRLATVVPAPAGASRMPAITAEP